MNVRPLALAVAVASLASTGLAQSITNSGDVTVGGNVPAPSSPASQWAPGTLWISQTTSGSTVVKSGATINTAVGVVGFHTGSSGLLRVSDIGSAVVLQNLVVGSGGGQGRLEVLDGGRVQALSLDLATTDSAPSDGSVLVRGAGSLVRIVAGSATTLADRYGSVADLTIDDGGLYEAVTEVRLAYSPNSAETGVASVNLTGTGSRLHVGAQLQIGQSAGGSATVNIGAGAAVSSNGYIVGKTGVVNLDGGTFGLGTGAISFNNGTIRGAGLVTGGLLNDVTGTISVRTGGELRLMPDRAADQFLNRGRIENVGGTFTLGIAGSNQNGGQIVGRDASFKFGDRNATSAFVNIGQIAFTGGSNDVVGPISNSAKILIDGSSIVTFASNVTNNSELRVNAGSRAIFLGTISGNGVVGGGASVASALVAPGGQGVASLMNFDGPLTMEPQTASLAIDLGTQSDRLVSGGVASVGGTLSLSAINGTPAMYVGQRIVQASSLVGKFDRIEGTLPSATVGLAVSYDATGITVTPALPGDADLNGSVKFADLVTLAQHYNQANGQSWSTGDFGGDGAVGFADLVVLAQHYNQTTAVNIAGAPANFAADWALAQSLIPEPGVAAVFGFGLTLLRRRGR